VARRKRKDGGKRKEEKGKRDGRAPAISRHVKQIAGSRRGKGKRRDDSGSRIPSWHRSAEEGKKKKKEEERGGRRKERREGKREQSFHLSPRLVEVAYGRRRKREGGESRKGRESNADLLSVFVIELVA